MIKRQYKTFRRQSTASLVIYGTGLAVVLYLVNCDPSWGYGPNVILDNVEFNLFVAVTLGLGVASVLLSIKPNYTDFIL